MISCGKTLETKHLKIIYFPLSLSIIDNCNPNIRNKTDIYAIQRNDNTNEQTLINF